MNYSQIEQATTTRSGELSVQNAGLFSFITFHWIFRYLWDILKYGVVGTAPICPNSDSCTVNSPRLDGLLSYQRVKNGHNLSVITLLWKFVKTRTIFACIIYSLASLLSLASLIIFLPKIFGGESYTYLYVLTLLGTELLSAFLYSWSSAINLRTAIRLRSACFSSLCRQAMMTSLTYHLSSWQLVSFLLSEGQNVHNLVMAVPNLICAPIIIFCAMLFIGIRLGFWGYLSVVVVILFFPVFIIFTLLSKNLLRRAAIFSDERVKLLEEFIINNIYVKFFKQEEFFETAITDKREQEVKNMKRAGLYDNICFSFILLQPLLSLSALFIAYNMIDPSERVGKLPEFAAICLILHIHINQHFNNFWHSLSNFIKGTAALNKYKKVMMYETIKLKTHKPEENNLSVYMEEAYFQWTKDETLNVKNSSANILYTDQNDTVYFPKNTTAQNVLCDINLSIEKGKLIGICGTPGSGKTSLLLAVMGLLLQRKGKRNTVGNFAYLSQEPIIFNESLKRNITFGQELEPQRYYRTTMHCNLLEDIAQFSEHDDTIIESKLLTLEQKQRIALARALYSDGDIYLLDNPLSALEHEKCLQIFDNCIIKSLQDKTVLLVTDHVECLEQCHEVCMLQDGQILFQGIHAGLLKTEPVYAEFISYLKNQKTMCRDKSTMFETSGGIPTTPKDVRKFASNYSIFSSMNSLNDDDVVDGANSKINDYNSETTSFISVLVNYISHLGNACSVIFLMLAQVLNATFISFLPIYFIFSLLELYYNFIFLASYCALFIIMLILGVIINYYFNKKMFAASIQLHNELLKKLYRATLSFFQSKSLSIISTISVQLQLTDLDIPRQMQNIVLNFFVILIVACLIPLVSFWYLLFLAVAITVMILAAAFVRNVLLSFNQHIMHYIELLYTQVMVVLTARPIIQAYDKINDFSKRVYNDYDEYIVYLYIVNAAKGWLIFLLHILSVLLFSSVAFATIFSNSSCYIWDIMRSTTIVCNEVDSKNNSLVDESLSESKRMCVTLPDEILVQEITCKALAIVCILQMCFSLQKILVVFVDTSLGFDMLGRVLHFKTKITMEEYEEEYFDSSNKVLEEKAPSIDLVNVTLTSPEHILNGITLKIRENEKIGFLELSSSQRKALIAVLYNLTEVTSGHIFIGNRKLSQIPLQNLRSLISVIPAEPYLFNTSIKKMLTSTKSLIQDLAVILEKFLLLERVRRLPQEINSNAEQFFNSEEKQILCLARAYLEQTPVLIIENYVNGSKLEHILTTQVRELFPQSTVLIFANNGIVLKNCDTVVSVRKGKVKTIGSTTGISNSQLYVCEAPVNETSF